jgi:glycosyltransferase involved in cell wall biosynthesis
VRSAPELLVNGRYIGDVIRAVYERDALDCPAGCHVRPGYPLAPERRFEGRFSVNGIEVRRPYVLLTNRHEPQKRFDLAISAMAGVRAGLPGVQMVVPGPATAHTGRLLDQVVDLRLDDTVLFVGQVSEAQLDKLYEGAAVYVCPAPEEDFGLGIVEAMARGIPVVAWDHAGPTVTVRHGVTGRLARPYDVAELAGGIAALLSDRASNHAAGLRSHSRAQAFDWTRHVGVLHRTLQEVIEQAASVAPAAEPETATPRAS